MTALAELLPNVEQLLALEPEELGAVLLPVYAKEQDSRDCFDPGALVYWTFHHQEACPYPSASRDGVLMAVMEAAAWLEAAGLIMHAPTQAASFKTLTRRGRRLANMESLAEFQKASQLPRRLLHPRIADNAYLNFARAKYDTAVFEAFKEVEVAVRDASGLTRDLGVALMRKAFNVETGPLRDPEQDGGERQAVSDLFAGALGSYKNPHSHRRVELDASDAVEMIMLASHLLRIVDVRLRMIPQMDRSRLMAEGSLMICATCHGARAIQSPSGAPIPCPECYGTGITSCCDGACGGPGDVTNGPVPPEPREPSQTLRDSP